MKLYLSGGIAGIPDFHARFAKNARNLASQGYEVVNPVEVDGCSPAGEFGECLKDLTAQRGDPGEHTVNCYLRYDIAALMLCDGIAMMDGHEKSKGAVLELFLARQVGIEIDTVAGWILRRKPK